MTSGIRLLLGVLLMVFPWPLRRRLMRRLLGYDLAPDCRIGFSLVVARHVRLASKASIGHLTVIRNLDALEMGACARIGHLNWIFGLGPKAAAIYFTQEKDRESRLTLSDHAAITARHIIDCTNRVTIGAYTVVAGFRSQILTHAPDLSEGIQTSAPVTIGAHCFTGTACVILKGAVLPDRCILGAASLLAKAYDEPLCLYAGVPARKIKTLPPDMAHFQQGE